MNIFDGKPNLEYIAKAYDMPFIRIQDMDNLEEKICKILEKEESYLVECVVDPEVNAK